MDRLRRLFTRDGIAALINAIVSVPDGLASAALAGVNPVYGLYTSIVAPIAGSSIASSQLMQISTTSASALAAEQAIAGYPAGQRGEAIFLLTFCIGIWLTVFGVLRLGRLVRFVSHAVMTGLLIGVAVALVLDQSAPLVGIATRSGNEVFQFLDLLTVGVLLTIFLYVVSSANDVVVRQLVKFVGWPNRGYRSTWTAAKLRSHRS